MENNNKKGWTGRQINRALPHLCQNGVPSSTDDERWVGTTPFLLFLGAHRRQSIPACCWHGNKARMPQGILSCFLPNGSCQPSKLGCWCWSFPQSFHAFSQRQRRRRRAKGRDPFADSSWWFPRYFFGVEDIISWASWGSCLRPALLQNGRRNKGMRTGLSGRLLI